MEESKQPPEISAESEIQNPKSRTPPFLWLVLGLHISMAFTYTCLIPPGRGPDEPHHLAYIAHLHNYHELPHLTSPRASRDERDNAIAIHPPVYYVAGWPLYELIKGLPRDSIERVFRWLAVLMGAATVFLTWRIGVTLFPENPHLPVAAATFMAFLPGFQLLSSVMNNDGPMMLLSTTLLLLLVRCLNRTVSVAGWASLGALYGMIVMTKASGAAVFPVSLVLLGWHHRRLQHSWRQSAARGIAFYASALLISAWWFLDLYWRFGRLHPIPRFDYAADLLYDSLADLLTSERGWLCVMLFLVGVQKSIWGQVDWFLPTERFRGMALFAESEAFYRLFTVVACVSLAGLVWLSVNLLRKKTWYSQLQIAGLALLAAHFLLSYAALAHFAFFVHPGGYQGGRYLYPSVAAFSTLFVVGLMNLLPPRAHRYIAPALLIGLLVWNLFCALNLVGCLNPVYAPGQGIQIDLG